MKDEEDDTGLAWVVFKEGNIWCLDDCGFCGICISHVPYVLPAALRLIFGLLEGVMSSSDLAIGLEEVGELQRGTVLK